ncbi:hypothetical protein HWV62_4601 [Athelia sp. TMB]|nr:hypothetical protein HWV62_4601 [Athelia sp. TMB]
MRAMAAAETQGVASSAKAVTGSVAKSPPHCYWVLLSDQLRVVAFDPAFRDDARLGTSASKLLKRRIFDFVHKEDRQDALATMHAQWQAKSEAQPIFVKRFLRFRYIRSALEDDPKAKTSTGYMPVHLRVHWVRVGESAKLALCFIHLTSNAYVPCGSLPLSEIPSITREEFSVIAMQLKSHFESQPEPQQELFPKHLFQMVSLGPKGTLRMGLIWPPDTAERNDSAIFLGVLGCLHESLPSNCWTLNIVHDVFLGMGEFRSIIIKFGDIAFAFHEKVYDVKKIAAEVNAALT